MTSLYVKRKQIGHGTYGRVWKVEHVCSKKFFALKEARKILSMQMLLDEIKILKFLEHENIIKYIDSFVSEKVEETYLVTELCDRGSLAKFIVSTVKSHFSKIPTWSLGWV